MSDLAGAHGAVGMSMSATAAVMLGDMFGLGQLTLPQTFARLGWLPGSMLIGCFCLLTLYSAHLYQRLAVRVPQATMFDQVASLALGRLGTALVWASCYMAVLLCPIIFQITCAEALKQVLYQWPVTTLHANLAVAALILPLAQFQDMEGIALVSLLGTLGQMTAIIIVVGKLALALYEQHQQGLPAPPTHMAGSSSFPVALVGVMDVLFCYGGQPNWWRYITCMNNRTQFVRSSCLAVTFMTLFYVCVALVGYLALGDGVDLSQAVTSLLKPDLWTAIMNAGLFLHCLFAYQININVWTASVLELGAGFYKFLTHSHSVTPDLIPSLDTIKISDTQPVTLPAQCDTQEAFDCHPAPPSAATNGSHPVSDSLPYLAQQAVSSTANGGSCCHSAEARGHTVQAVIVLTDDLKAPLLHASTDADETSETKCANTHHSGLPVQCRVQWAVLTVLCILVSIVASLMFSTCFSVVMAVISASGDAMSLVGLPCLFSLYLIRDLPSWEKPLCWSAVVGAVVISVLGLYSSCQQLVKAYMGGGTGSSSGQ